MTPIERAARALCEAQGIDPDKPINPATLGPRVMAEIPPPPRGQQAPLLQWQAAVPQVRAVIAAIREPSEIMCAIGGKVPEMGSMVRRGAAYSSWQAMIDALLAD